MNLLETIENFGTIDAESDENLIDYFYQTEVINDLIDYKKSLVIGRKGTGKTAIYKFLQHKEQEKFSPLLFRDYPWKLHDKFRNQTVSDRESYVNSWTFFFYIEIFKRIIVLKDSVKDKKTIKQINSLEKWIKKNWGTTLFDHKEVMQPHSKLKWTLNPQIMGCGLGSLSKEFSQTEKISGTLSEYNRKFHEILLKILQSFDNEIIIAFDELDLAYDINDNEYKNRLIGLLLTTYNFFQIYREKIKIFVFLRSDIFNMLDFQDKNKIKDNMVEFLDWDPTSVSSKLSLKKLIANRIAYMTNDKSDNFERVWNEVFDNAKIGNNKLKWNFIIDRTFLRPRDVIKFINLALDEAKNRLLTEPETVDKINNNDIHTMRSKYSTYLFEELKDEISGKYPNYNLYFDILRSIHTMNFSRDTFEKHFKLIPNKKKQGETVDSILEKLYEFSVIGFYKAGGGYGGSEYRFQYKSDYQAFNSQATTFQVHAGFKEYLELVENR